MKGDKKIKTSEKVTMSHFSAELRDDISDANVVATRSKFLHAYAETFGNVSASCAFAGISRKTYYRWMKSISRVNRTFQKQLRELKPKERQIDLAESALMEKVSQGHWPAIEFILKTRGRIRGWVTREADDASPKPSDAQKTASAVRLWLDWYPGADIEQIESWIETHSNVSGVECQDIVSELGLDELMDRRARLPREDRTLGDSIPDPNS